MAYKTLNNIGAYNVVANYKASGMRTTTTGTIAGGSLGTVTALSVGFVAECKVGQGILIKGAGASGAHHVTIIATIPSTTSVTLSVNASTAVTGAVVQHDDTVAINAAHAAAYNAGSGEVFLPKTGVDGYYRINGPRNGTTNSIITLPQSILYNAVPPSLVTKGEVKGSYNGPSSRWEGVILDSLDVPASGGTAPSIFAAAPFVVTTAEGGDYEDKFQRVNWHFENFTLLVRANSGYNGIMLGNAMSGSVGDFVAVLSTDISLSIVEPTVPSTGIFFPRVGNNIFLFVGRVHVAGFSIGIYATEHLEMRGPVVAGCTTGIMIGESIHPIVGYATVENCKRFLEVESTATAAQINIQLEMEPFIGSGPFDIEAGGILKDINNVARGRVDYQAWGQYSYFDGDARFTDGVSNSTTTYTSATAVFVVGDVGKSITGTNIPNGTIIASRTNATTVVLSASATGSGSGGVFFIKSRGSALQPNGASKVKITNLNEPVGSNAAKMWLSTATNLPHDAYTRIVLDTKVGPDAGSIANTTTGVFTVTERGWYQINASSGFWTAANPVRVRIGVNDTPIGTSIAPTGSTEITISEITYLNAGDAVTLIMYQFQNSGTASYPLYVAAMDFAPRLSIVKIN